jgi:hypothetical protein
MPAAVPQEQSTRSCPRRAPVCLCRRPRFRLLAMMLQGGLCEAQRLVGDAQHGAIDERRIQACDSRSLAQRKQLYPKPAVLLLTHTQAGGPLRQQGVVRHR